MEIFWLILIIFAVVSRAKKKEQEAQKKAQASRNAQAAWQENQPGRQPMRFPEDGSRQTQPRPSTAPVSQPVRQQRPTRPPVPAQRTAAAAGSRMTVPAAAENRAAPQARVAATQQSTLDHVIQPSSQGGHSHMESSMQGLAPCPPQKPVIRPATKPAEDRPLPLAAGLNFNRDALVNGILYAEILGKPKALRRK